MPERSRIKIVKASNDIKDGSSKISRSICRLEYVQKESLDLLSRRESQEYGIDTPNKARYRRGVVFTEPMSVNTRCPSRKGSHGWMWRKKRAVSANNKSVGGSVSITLCVFWKVGSIEFSGSEPMKGT
jgi:hypothetical protein